MHSENHKARTLWLCGVLHGFTHVYHVALMPLYLLIQSDLELRSVEQATLLLTVMMFAYFLPSYGLGVLADRISRKKLLTAGLAINAAGFVLLSFAPNYWCALASVVIAGIGGSFFHPSATAMIARLYPVGTGKAFGLIGVGASVGFLIGPIYAGWRAETAGWRGPILELGVTGLIAAALFFCLAADDSSQTISIRKASRQEKLFPTPALWVFFLSAAVLLGLRDFAGSGMGSLGSLFMQKAHGFDLKETGAALSAIFLVGIVSNPLFGHLSDRGRIRWVCLVLLLAAIILGVFPRLRAQWLVPAMAAYGFCFMASYPMVEAALMESVPDSVRGRVFGLFITVGGLIGNLSHWMVGDRVRALGDRATAPESYHLLYGALAALILMSLAALPCLIAIRKREQIDMAPTGQPTQPAPVVNPQFE